MEREINDFVVETKGRCFFCCQHVSPENDCSVIPTQSLQSLSRFLKLDMKRVFTRDGLIPPQLIAKVRKSRLKVSLCEECSIVNEKFSNLHRQLEKIEMEIMTWVKTIVGRSNNARDMNQLRMLTEKGLFDVGKLKVVEELRDDTLKRCSAKICASLPRVRVQNLNMKEVAAEQLNLKYTRHKNLSTSLSLPNASKAEVGYGCLKTEPNNDSPMSDTMQEDGSSNLGDFDDPVYSPGNGDNEIDDLPQLLQPHSKREGEPSLNTSANFASSPPNAGSVRNNCLINSKTGKPSCRKCLKTFSSYPAFYLHYKSEHLKIRYKCSACGRQFRQIGMYNRHQRISHQGVKFKCQKCNQIFTLESNLQKHRSIDGCAPKETFELPTLAIIRPPKSKMPIQSMCKLNDSTGRYSCRLCLKELASKNGFRTHYARYHNLVKYRCTLCQVEFTTREYYRDHHDTKHLGIEFSCPKCKKIFPRKATLSIHLKNAACDNKY